jgi:hypothetical protein
MPVYRVEEVRPKPRRDNHTKKLKVSEDITEIL